jgi:hypothetical protein
MVGKLTESLRQNAFRRFESGFSADSSCGMPIFKKDLTGSRGAPALLRPPTVEDQ